MDGFYKMGLCVYKKKWSRIEVYVCSKCGELFHISYDGITWFSEGSKCKNCEAPFVHEVKCVRNTIDSEKWVEKFPEKFDIYDPDEEERVVG